MKLGRIEEVKLREIWKNEAYDFTPWLAEEENLSLLSETIGLPLTNPKVEVPVGSFSADILCDIEESDKKVIIENQLEDSNHDHLGKTIVYASGLKANVVVWIVKRVRDEHASAIEWLNNHTDSDISFFLIELKAIKIGNSLPAPQFEIIQQPNNFEKFIKAPVSEKTETEQARYDFWVQFGDFLDQSNSEFTAKKSNYDHWKTWGIGSSKYNLQVALNTKEEKAFVHLNIINDKSIFDQLYQKKREIELEIGLKLAWYRLDEKKASIISIAVGEYDSSDEQKWQELNQPILDMMEKFKKTFKKYL